jgi:hypothetical protein
MKSIYILLVNTVPNVGQFCNSLVSLHFSAFMQHRGLDFKNKSVSQLQRSIYTTEKGNEQIYVKTFNFTNSFIEHINFVAT